MRVQSSCLVLKLTYLQIPKSAKARGYRAAIARFDRVNKVWAEVKYDGERAQIHVEVRENNSSRITIFSKSKRDSTNDRFGVHHIIRAALGLPGSIGPHATTSPVKYNVILDAEMVPFHDTVIIGTPRAPHLSSGELIPCQSFGGSDA
jgi:DNA ligase-4